MDQFLDFFFKLQNVCIKIDIGVQNALFVGSREGVSLDWNWINSSTHWTKSNYTNNFDTILSLKTLRY
jgi:hypothetical protein